MKLKLRNMIQLHCWKRKCGVHGKSFKAMRRKSNVETKKLFDTTHGIKM